MHLSIRCDDDNEPYHQELCTCCGRLEERGSGLCDECFDATVGPEPRWEDAEAYQKRSGKERGTIVTKYILVNAGLRDDVIMVETLLGRLKHALEVGFGITPRHMAEALTKRERQTMARLLNKMLRSEGKQPIALDHRSIGAGGGDDEGFTHPDVLKASGLGPDGAPRRNDWLEQDHGDDI